MIDRLNLLRASTSLTGIDFIQVSASQRELLVFLQHDILPAALATALAAISPDQITISAEGQVDPPRIRVRRNVKPLPAPVNGRAVLRLQLERAGGFGFYRLRINAAAIDPYFNNVRFSFKAACDSELDCREPAHACPADETVDFGVDYRARDFWSFRQALLDFAAQRYPDWQDRLEADVGMMVLELLAGLGDEFAYAQDRLAREASLETASQRRSLRHLARLVDYRVGNGAGAFAWLDVEALASVSVAAGTAACDLNQQVWFEIGRGLEQMPPLGAPISFPISPARNQLSPYIWDENDTCLPAGSTSLCLNGDHALLLQPDTLLDPLGRPVLLRTDPLTPDLPARRLVVHILEALPDADPLTSQAITRIRWQEPTPWELDLQTLSLRGNLLPATSGRTREQRFRIGEPDGPSDPEPNLPRAVERLGIGSPLCDDGPGGAVEPARVKLLFSLPDSDATPLVWLAHPSAAGTRWRPEVQLIQDGLGAWHWLEALVGETTAGPAEQAFTLEDGVFRRLVAFEQAGRLTEHVDYASGEGSTIRFGDGVFGLQPPEHAKFTVRWRLGNGSRMNVAADTLVRWSSVPAGVGAVTNPLPASGGRDPETAEQIRVNAPHAFRGLSQRAVQTADYAAIAERLPWVQAAGATSRWTGSWPTVFVTPDPRAVVGLAAAPRRELEGLLDRVRQAGRDVQVLDPRYADIDLEIRLCAASNAYRGEVKEAALRALFGVGGRGGFFNPDNFSFGTPLSRAALIAALQAVPGVKAVEAMRVRRRGWFDWRTFDAFALPVGVNELVRVANNPALPERGAVRLLMDGGA
jgi:hypothetical protein